LKEIISKVNIFKKESVCVCDSITVCLFACLLKRRERENERERKKIQFDFFLNDDLRLIHTIFLQRYKNKVHILQSKTKKILKVNLFVCLYVCVCVCVCVCMCVCVYVCVCICMCMCERER